MFDGRCVRYVVRCLALGVCCLLVFVVDWYLLVVGVCCLLCIACARWLLVVCWLLSVLLLCVVCDFLLGLCVVCGSWLFGVVCRLLVHVCVGYVLFVVCCSLCVLCVAVRCSLCVACCWLFMCLTFTGIAVAWSLLNVGRWLLCVDCRVVLFWSMVFGVCFMCL